MSWETRSGSAAVPAKIAPISDTRIDSSTTGLRIELFGPFTVTLDGEPMAKLRTRRGQWLLALLALRARREVDRSWLAGMLWPDATESQALGHLRRTLTDLRTALGSYAWRLKTTSPRTVLLDVDASESDVAAFDVAAGLLERPDEDERALRDAARTSTKPLLEGVTEEWVFEERAPRQEIRARMLERAATLALARGDAETAITDLRALVAAEPMRESAARLLIEALGAIARYAESIQAYRQLREKLHYELNVEPSAETQATFARVRRAAKAQSAEPQAAAAATSPRPALRPGRVPAQVSEIVGRDQEAEELRLALASARLVTIAGLGGMGKTRLALHVARQIEGDIEGGAWFLDLAPLHEGELIVPALAELLETTVEPGQTVEQAITGRLTAAPSLLVVDNCEHLVADAARCAANWLAACPALRIIATSREPLGVPGEVVWRIPGLTLPLTTEMPSGIELMEFESTRLFLERAQAAMGRAPIDPVSAAATVEICRKLDGSPLAIELAAARTKVLSVTQIAQRLDDRFRLLASGPKGAPERHQTLRATIDWSYESLGRGEQRALRRFAVFAGSWSFESAEALIGESALDSVSSLADKSLISPVRGPDGEVRYRLLDTIRAYALEKLDAAGEEREAREAHASLMLSIAEREAVRVVGPDQGASLALLSAKVDDLRTALAWLVEAGESTRAMEMCCHLWRFWDLRALYTEARSWLDRALAARPASPSKALAGALNVAATFAWRMSDYEEAIRLYEESGVVAREAGHRTGEAIVALGLGNVYVYLDQPEKAAIHFERALPIFEEVGHTAGYAVCLSNLGGVLHTLHRYDAALEITLRSLERKRAGGQPAYLATTLDSLGIILSDMGRPEQAAPYMVEAATIRIELDDLSGLRYSLSSFASFFATQGDPEFAARVYGAFLASSPAPTGPGPALERNERRVVELLETALTPDGFAAKRAEGAEWTPHEAAAKSLERAESWLAHHSAATAQPKLG